MRTMDEFRPGEVADALEKAVEVLKERGWTQGELEDCTGRVCLAGAIYVAIHGQTDTREISHMVEGDMLLVRCCKEIGEVTGSWAVANFNDKVATSVDDVIDAAISAAKRLRELG